MAALVDNIPAATAGPQRRRRHRRASKSRTTATTSAPVAVTDATTAIAALIALASLKPAAVRNRLVAPPGRAAPAADRRLPKIEVAARRGSAATSAETGTSPPRRGRRGPITRDAIAGRPAPTLAASRPAKVGLTGWKIQVAATPTEASATAVSSTGPRVKARSCSTGPKGYTESVVKGQVTLYRARFSGFPARTRRGLPAPPFPNRRFACLALQ